MYVAGGDARSGRTEILVAHSGDGGRTWSAPVRVDASTTARSSGGPDAFMPTIAVERDGVVGVLWYDRRDVANNRD